MKKIALLSLLLSLSVAYAKVNVVVSITPQQSFVEKIGADKVHVTTMVKPGSDPHSYEPKPSQMKAISNAHLYFPIKIEFENSWLEKFEAQNKKMKFVDMTQGISFIKMQAHSHDHGHQENALPYEWAGQFYLKEGEYRWSFSKIDGTYADPAMKFLMIEASKDSDELIEVYEDSAKAAFASDTTTKAKDGETIYHDKGIYQLHFDESKEMTVFRLTIKKSGHYLFFTEHMPFEFEADEHFLKDSKRVDIEPLATVPESDGHDHGHASVDPHTWTSPENVKIMAKNIYDALVAMDGENSQYYQANYEKFLDEIEATDKKIKEIFSVLPAGTKFMVFHPSWGYFAKAYNLTQLPIEVEGKDPKPKMLQKIIDKARAESVKAIFTQKEFSDKSAKAIARELNIKVLKESPLAKDWSQNLINMADAIANNR
ncbi:MAG: zinc ABC transporter substrate-binding protein [Epsilonproteobacteria bacterium]|nr:zinc ABC transporter substrate-binding protein [Campylobacterota bacterium]